MSKGRVLGRTGEKTNTCLCNPCVNDLLELTQNRLLRGDNNISYQIKKMQRTQIFNQFTSRPVLSDEEKTKVVEVQKQVAKRKLP